MLEYSLTIPLTQYECHPQSANHPFLVVMNRYPHQVTIRNGTFTCTYIHPHWGSQERLTVQGPVIADSPSKARIDSFEYVLEKPRWTYRTGSVSHLLYPGLLCLDPNRIPKHTESVQYYWVAKWLTLAANILAPAVIRGRRNEDRSFSFEPHPSPEQRQQISTDIRLLAALPIMDNSRFWFLYNQITDLLCGEKDDNIVPSIAQVLATLLQEVESRPQSATGKRLLLADIHLYIHTIHNVAQYSPLESAISGILNLYQPLFPKLE